MNLSEIDNLRIRKELPAITLERVEAFRAATCSGAMPLIPLSFCTAMRDCEFEMLARLEIDMRRLLHADQEYEYRFPLEIGDCPIVETYVDSHRERGGMHLITLASTVSVGASVRVKASCSFVIKDIAEEGSG